MSHAQRVTALQSGVELALKDYLGTDSFPSEEWPAVARAFAELVDATTPVASGHDRGPSLLGNLEDLLGALRGVMEL